MDLTEGTVDRYLIEFELFQRYQQVLQGGVIAGVRDPGYRLLSRAIPISHACLDATYLLASRRLVLRDMNALRQAVEALSGVFDNSAQVAGRPGEFFLITLRHIPIGNLPGYWLYLEQSVVGNPQPYRQRVYCIVSDDARTVRSRVLEFKDPAVCKHLIGATPGDPRLGHINPTRDLVYRPGCDVILQLSDDLMTFAGGTVGKGCESTFQGARHCESQVLLTVGDPVTLSTLDQGFGSDDGQVWGSENGPYLFTRTSQFAVPDRA